MRTSARKPIRPGRWSVTAGIALIALGTLSFNAFADFTATSTVTNSATAGTMSLALGATGSVTNRMNLSATDIVPGDTMQRTLTITPGGTLTMTDMKLDLTETATSAPGGASLTSHAVNGLQILIERCTVQWTEVGGAAPFTYTCGGATSTMMASTNVLTQKTAGATSLGNETFAGPNYVRITLTFPSTAGDTFQGSTTTLSFAWSASQPTAGSK